MRYYFLFAAALSATLTTSAAQAGEGYSAKALFFGEDNRVVSASTEQKSEKLKQVLANTDVVKKTQVKQKITSPERMGINYFVRLKNADGTTTTVAANRKFNAGERFQLGVKVNSPSYVYILNEDPNGKVTQLYPQPGQDSYINAMGTVFIPAKGAFEFDNNPGTEKLLVYVSKKPLTGNLAQTIGTRVPDLITLTRNEQATACATSLVNSTQQATVVAAAGDATYSAKGIAFTADTACAEGVKQAHAGYTAKGISFSDSDDGLSASSYIVKKTSAADANLYLKINLNHQ